MKKQIHHFLAKTPLFIRVVSLYVVLWQAGAYLSPLLLPAPSVTTVASIEVVPVITPVETKETRGVPRRIELPRIGLVREVVDGHYNSATQGWTLTEDKVQYALMTTSVNDKSGQTLLYGHNTSAVLEPVWQVAPGDELLVHTDTGRIFVYTYSRDRFVVPTDVSVLQEAADAPRVVLMTCEGWLNETRRLLYFDFKEVR